MSSRRREYSSPQNQPGDAIGGTESFGSTPKASPAPPALHPGAAALHSQTGARARADDDDDAGGSLEFANGNLDIVHYTDFGERRARVRPGSYRLSRDALNEISFAMRSNDGRRTHDAAPVRVNPSREHHSEDLQRYAAMLRDAWGESK